MSLSRRAIAVCVVTGATVVACLTVTPNLSSTQQLAVVVTSPVDFGDVQVNTTVGGKEIFVSPAAGSGDSDDTITSLSFSCSDVSIAFTVPFDVFRHCGLGTGTATDAAVGVETDALPCANAVVQNAQFPVTFHPTTPGPKSCQVTIQGTFGTKTVFLRGNATKAPFALKVQPAAINFGDVRVGQSDTQLVTVTNTGANAITVMSATFNPMNAFDLVTPVTPHILAPDEKDTLQVVCAPGSATTFASTMTVFASDGLAASTTLTCRGTDSLLDPVAVPRTVVTRVEEPAMQTITITNRGNSDASIDKFELAWADTSTTSEVGLTAPPTPLTLKQDEFAVVTVRYDAKTERKPNQLATLQITHDGKVDQFIVNGEAQATSLGITPDGHDFETVCVGDPQAIDVAVFANQTGNFVLSAASAPAPFSFTPKGGTSIGDTAIGNHGNDLMFEARVTPTAAGEMTGTAMIVTNIPKSAPRPVTFHLDAIATGVGTPFKVDFGTRESLAATSGERVRITNCTGADLAISGAHIEGDNLLDFAIVAPPLAEIPRTLSHTTALELLVSLTPRETGIKIGALVVDHSPFAGQSIAVVPLEAVVTGEPVETDPRETYYNCSAGGAAGAAPVGLALFGLVLRRRRRR